MATNHEVVSSNLTGQVCYKQDIERLSIDGRFLIGTDREETGLL